MAKQLRYCSCGTKSISNTMPRFLLLHLDRWSDSAVLWRVKISTSTSNPGKNNKTHTCSWTRSAGIRGSFGFLNLKVMPVYTTNPNPKRDFSPRPLILPPPLLSLSNQVLYFYIPSQLWCPWLSRSTFLASICDATSQSVQQSDIMAPIRDGRSFTGFSAHCKAPELEIHCKLYAGCFWRRKSTSDTYSNKIYA